MIQGQLDPIQLMRKIAELEDKINALRTITTGGVWQDWTPEMSGSGGTAGTYVEDLTYARYSIIGNICNIIVRKRITNVGSWSGDVRISLPVARGGVIGGVIGNGYIAANTSSVTSPKGIITFVSGITATFYKTFLSNLQWSDIAVNDWVLINASYEI